MSELSKRYHEIIEEIDNRITNEEDLKFVKSKISDISIIFIDIIDRMSEVIDEKIVDIERNQKTFEKKLDRVQDVIDVIERDMYDENGADSEIVCPYCNNEFSAEINFEDDNEIECPECHNIIEIDINADLDEEENYGCHGSCRGCGGCDCRNDDEEDI